MYRKLSSCECKRVKYKYQQNVKVLLNECFLTRGHLDVGVPLCLISVYQTKTLIHFARAIAPEFDHPDDSDVYCNINTIAWTLSARIASPPQKKRHTRVFR